MIVTLSAIYVLGLLHANSLRQDPDINNKLNYFRDLTDKGNLSDVEFRIIKERFSAELTGKINKSEKGSQLTLNYHDMFLWLRDADNSESLQDTQVVGSSVCNNKNGQAEYIEMETKRAKEHTEDCGIDWKANRSNDDKNEKDNNSDKENTSNE
jgi:hypothetical protein